MSRKIAREVAMKLTYQRMYACDDTYHNILEISGITDTPSDEDIAFAADIVEGVQANIKSIDEHILSASTDWTIERMSRVDLSILRVATYEMFFRDDIPIAVSINEAVDLAKQFSDEKAPKFINGLLGALSKPPIPKQE